MCLKYKINRYKIETVNLKNQFGNSTNWYLTLSNSIDCTPKLSLSVSLLPFVRIEFKTISLLFGKRVQPGWERFSVVRSFRTTLFVYPRNYAIISLLKKGIIPQIYLLYFHFYFSFSYLFVFLKCVDRLKTVVPQDDDRTM